MVILLQLLLITRLSHSQPTMHLKNEEYATFTGVCNSVATIKHSMDLIKEAIHMLNPGQTPVMVSDQLLFALAKQF